MSNIFISYSWKDKEQVMEIVNYIKEHHNVYFINVDIDEEFQYPGAPIVSEIKNHIHKSDYVLLFLSPNSLKSKWVFKEIYETLYLEIKQKEVKLIPLVIKKCNIPEAISSRLYIDFAEMKYEAIDKLLVYLGKGINNVFEFENNYYVLNISEPKLEIYHTSELYNWREFLPGLRFHEMVDSYLLLDFRKEPGTLFKNYVAVNMDNQEKAESIRSCLRKYRCSATGSGSTNEYFNKRLIWFCDDNYQVIGPDLNNVWPNSKEQKRK